MKLFKKIRKGFTLIELVVVIAVIAILSAVSIVSYVSITNKAKQSNDQQKVDQVNLSLASLEVSGKPKTMYEAVKAVEDDGFKPENFKAEAKNYRFAYAMEENRFVIVEKESKVVYPKDFTNLTKSANLWLLENEEGSFSDGFSRYFRGKGLSKPISNTAGIDVGENVGVSKVTYTSSSSDNIVIRTNGDQTEVNVYAPSANVDYYGFAKIINVADVAPDSLHIYGAVNQLALASGHVEIESTGIVFDVVQFGSTSDHAAPGNAGTISNKGFVADTSYKKHTSGEGGTAPSQAQIDAAQAKIDDDPGSTKTVGGAYEIGSLAQMEAFRDAVNAGNDFSGLTIKLTKDISLNDGWKPIGEGSRKVGKSNTSAKGITTFFKGTFDGNGKTISNLNNKGFIPTEARLVPDNDVNTYTYGLFALVGSGAVIQNLNLTNVSIDTTSYKGALGDSVGGLIGYADGKITVSYVDVSGSIKAADSVAGIVGRIYNESGSVIDHCRNSANITIGTDTDQKGAGIVGYTNKSLTISNCKNAGVISGGEVVGQTQHFRASIAVIANSACSASTFTDNYNGTAVVSSTGVAIKSSDKLIGSLD